MKNNHRKNDENFSIRCLLIFVLFIMALSFTIPGVIAHGPSKIALEIDDELNQLKVTLDHKVADPSKHYIYQIVIRKNGNDYLDFNYTIQPDDTSFYHTYEVNVTEDDVVKVTAYCNVGGELSASLDLSKETAAQTENPKLWPYHAGLMGAGLLCMLSAVIIAKFLKGKKKWWLKIHKPLGTFGGLLSFGGLVMAYIMVEKAGGDHFSVPHTYLGSLTMLAIILTAILGNLQFKVKNKKYMATLHRWIGRICLALMLFTILGGLFAAGVIR